MKKKLLCATLIISTVQGFGQTFTLLANDPSGDVSLSFIADVQSLSYSIDNAQDSIWFKVQTYTAVGTNDDVGMMFGLDTNMIITDGLAWNGNNNSMKYDLGFLVFQNSMSPNYYGYLYSSSGSSQVAITVQRPDNFTFIINTRLSLLDQDGSFNLLFGSGAFDILSTRDVYDDVPNSGYLTISPALGANDIKEKKNSLEVYPNPAAGEIKIQIPGSFVQIDFYDATGRKMDSHHVNSASQLTIDVSDWETGIYFIAARDEKNNYVIKEVIKI
jgi:hypothetical protein